MLTGRRTVLIALAALISGSFAGFGPTTAGAAESSGTVLITGANRGLGLEMARQFDAAGWQVIGTARSPDQATELQALEVRIEALDVADAESVAALAERLADEPLDLLINNAGIFPRVGDLASVDFADVERVLAVNTIGPMRVTQALLPNLRAGEQKRIVHISSDLGSIAQNSSGSSYGYRESKTALNMFNASLSAELADEGFTCVVISPGWVQTDMGGSSATLTPEQSVNGIFAIIDELAPSQSGMFLRYDGNSVPW